MKPVDSPDDLRKERDALLGIVATLHDRITHLWELLVKVYRSPEQAKDLIRPELENWKEPDDGVVE